MMMDSRNRKLVLLSLGFGLIISQIDFNTASPASQSNPAKYPLDDLYANLLQREYTGPLSLPNHFVVERKAQRSPSLRLRYGRSDPDLLFGNSDKRWFGDVNQKPIRSPSLRLRFGKRADSTIIDENSPSASAATDLTMPVENRYESHQTNDGNYGRIRWGKLGAPMEEDEEFNNYEDEYQSPIPAGFHLSHGLTSPSFQKIFNYLNHLDGNNNNDDMMMVNYAPSEFNRETRKPRAPLRLRWGRSAPNLPKSFELNTLDNNNLMTSIGNNDNNNNRNTNNHLNNNKLLSSAPKPDSVHNG